MTKLTIEEIQAKIAKEITEGERLRNLDIDAKVARRKELGLSLICTVDELDATPMPEGYRPV